MHEVSMAQSILAIALAEMNKRPGARLKTARVVIGRQRAVVPDNLRFAFETLAENTPAAGARLAIRQTAVTARCPACGWRGAIRQPRYACGACGAGDIELTGGEELYLESLEVEDDEPPHD